MNLDPRKSHAEFSVAYSGPAVASGSMDVNDFAPALLALGKLCEESNSVLNKDRARVSVHVRSEFKKGSFLVSLDVIQELSTLLSSENVETAKPILQWLGLASGPTIGLLRLILWLAGRKPKEVKKLDDGKVNISVEGNNNNITVNNTVAILYNDPNVRKSFSKVVEPLNKDGIDEFQVHEGGEVVERITKAEREYVDGAQASEGFINDEEYEATYRIEKLSFTDGLTWRFTDGNVSFGANVQDQEFLDRVSSGQVTFASGDALRLRIRKRSVQTEADMKTTYTILRVLEHFPAPRQLQLDPE